MCAIRCGKVGFMFFCARTAKSFPRKNTMKNSKKSKPNSRRRFLGSVAGSVLIPRIGSGSVERVEAGAMVAQEAPAKLAIEDFQPKSMLVVPEHPTPRARYPVIDVHTHISGVFGRQRVADPRSEEHTSELQSLRHLVCRLLLE